MEIDSGLTTVAYLVALVDTRQNDCINPRTAKFILRWLFDVEEQVKSAKNLGECMMPEELLWYLLDGVVEKARIRVLFISIIGKPGRNFESNIGRPFNVSLAEAIEADRVVWQRTPRAS